MQSAKNCSTARDHRQFPLHPFPTGKFLSSDTVLWHIFQEPRTWSVVRMMCVGWTLFCKCFTFQDNLFVRLLLREVTTISLPCLLRERLCPPFHAILIILFQLFPCLITTRVNEACIDVAEICACTPAPCLLFFSFLRKAHRIVCLRVRHARRSLPGAGFVVANEPHPRGVRHRLSRLPSISRYLETILYRP